MQQDQYRATPSVSEQNKVNRLDYVADKIGAARLVDTPFPHIYIEDLFTEQDFGELINTREINIPPMTSDEALIAELERRNFKAIPFPGTTTDIAAYLAWHADPAGTKHMNQETCEGYGVVMRLQDVVPGTILDAARSLFESDRFWLAAAAKFSLQGMDMRRDYGLQKYLDGYEISPHPDVREKALTFMVNINPAPDSENIPFHTHYMTFRPERDYVRKIWSTQPTVNRAWVPWDWCETQYMQTKNNSMVMFSPGNDTLHAIKASYDHLRTQRTQFYGNLWRNGQAIKRKPDFRELTAMAGDM